MKAKELNSSIAVFWRKLQMVQAVDLRCTKENDWHGFAKVVITPEQNEALLFHEKGEWKNTNLSFTNTLRWILHLDRISLEHLRFGSHLPVRLVDLTPTAENCLNSISPHLCGQDKYSAQIFWDQEGIHLHWDILGPLKNEKIYSHYR